SIVLRYLRATVHQSLGWPDGNEDEAALGMADDLTEEDLEDGDSLGLFEWSAPPSSSRNDRIGWAHANPSMNYTELVENVITERAIAAAMRTDPPSVFFTEVMCRWISTADGGPFPEGKWVATRDNDARRALWARRVLAIDVSWDRTMGYIARAGVNTDNVPVVDIAAARGGTDWIVPWLVEYRVRYDAVTLQANGAPVSSLIEAIRNAKMPDGKPADIPLVEWSGPDLGRATGIAYDAVDKGKVKHLQHPGLDMAAGTARAKPMGDSWVIDRKNSPADPASLIAFIGALWLLERAADDRPDQTPTQADAIDPSEMDELITVGF
ncbi:MAG: terminase, partial [Rhodococcus sp. (in: high G+C Gram-positive bacteria)]